MDSLSHTRVAKLLLSHVEERCGVTFDEAGFLYGNLKPDLTGTYLTKRHYPSVMYDEVMESCGCSWALTRSATTMGTTFRLTWGKSAIT